MCEYGLQSCRGKSAGVAKRPRERSPAKQSGTDSQLLHLCNVTWEGADPERDEARQQRGGDRAQRRLAQLQTSPSELLASPSELLASLRKL
jgi:hypothetical protein